MVVRRAESEEREDLVRLGDALDQTRLEQMRKAVTLAEQIAPTRPHPGVEV